MARDTRARIVKTTAGLLQLRGFHGTSLNDILDASDAPRGSLYYHFPGGKEQLVLEATLQGIETATRALEEELANREHPAEAVRAYVEGAARLLQDSEFTFGCPVAPLILDETGAVSELAEACRSAVREWQRLLREAFVSAGIAAERAASLAALVVASLEGALLISRAERDTASLDVVARELESLVRTAAAG